MIKSHSAHEWIGILPLLHVIKHDSFPSCQPLPLPITEDDLQTFLFCGLNTTQFILRLPANNRYEWTWMKMVIVSGF